VRASNEYQTINGDNEYKATVRRDIVLFVDCLANIYKIGIDNIKNMNDKALAETILIPNIINQKCKIIWYSGV
jgi:hypothetical protein